MEELVENKTYCFLVLYTSRGGGQMPSSGPSTVPNPPPHRCHSGCITIMRSLAEGTPPLVTATSELVRLWRVMDIVFVLKKGCVGESLIEGGEEDMR